MQDMAVKVNHLRKEHEPLLTNSEFSMQLRLSWLQPMELGKRE